MSERTEGQEGSGAYDSSPLPLRSLVGLGRRRQSRAVVLNEVVVASSSSTCNDGGERFFRAE